MGEPNNRSKLGIATFEKRRYPRFVLDLPIEYQTIDAAQSREAKTGNASRGGLLVYLPEPVEIGQHLKIRLFFTRGKSLYSMQAEAEVVWVNTYFGKEGDYQCGVRFVDTSAEELSKLEEFLNRLSRPQKL